MWNAYVGSMRQAGFTANVPMYVASGLLTYGANDGEQSVSFILFGNDARWRVSFSSEVAHGQV